MPFLAQKAAQPQNRSAFGSRPSDPPRFSTGGDHRDRHDEGEQRRTNAVVIAQRVRVSDSSGRRSYRVARRLRAMAARNRPKSRKATS